ncbi:MAG: ComF family protein [Syntrophales bacterium]|nr:ComF family protein [Syntrophales bacterium]
MRSILKGLTDVIFPPSCVTCGVVLKPDKNLPFCPICFSRINFIRPPLCTRCGIPFNGHEAGDHLCGDCLTSEVYFSVARAVGRYENTILDAIHCFKYRGKIAVGEILGRLMADFARQALDIKDYSLIMPAPLHPKRLRERGFNQSVILAQTVSKRFSIVLDFMTLKRHIHTKPQVSLGKKERELNVRGAFEVSDKEKIRGKNIILVDDVYTTGSTVKECARVLTEGKAAKVAVLTFARAVQPDSGRDILNQEQI